MNEATARLKINKLLEAAGRRLITLSNGNLRYLRDLERAQVPYQSNIRSTRKTHKIRYSWAVDLKPARSRK